MKIGFVTANESTLTSIFPSQAEPDFISPEPLFTPDDYIAMLDLRAHGHEVQPIIWGAEPATLLDFDMIVVRSPWDYTKNKSSKQAFLDWISELDANNIPIANPPVLINWLLDKHYLQDFAALDIQVIPTVYYDACAIIELKDVFQTQGAFVLKPCISATGVGLFYIDSEEAAAKYQTIAQSAMQDATYMLQPFIKEISTNGEWSLVFLGGKYSHAILKKPANHSMLVHADHGGSLHFPVTPSPAVASFAHEVYSQLLPALQSATGITIEASSVLYMRVDVIETMKGPVLVECEGVEPELFFRASVGSETLFREALEETLTTED